MAQVKDIFDSIFTDEPLESSKIACKFSIHPDMMDSNYLKHYIDRALDNLLQLTKPYLRKGLYIHGIEFHNDWDGTDMFTEIYGISARVSVVNQVPVVYKFVDNFMDIPPDVHFCNFCGGHTKNDMRGHCCACGGPRNERYLWPSKHI